MVKQIEIMKLGDVCTKIGSGATPRGGRGVYQLDGPYALIRSQNVHNDGFHSDGLALISEHHATQLRNVEVRSEDVLLNITGDSVARVCLVSPDTLPARVNQHVAIVRPDPERLNPRYLRYWLISPEIQSLLLSIAGAGGTRNALTKAMIESLEIPAPPLSEQYRIAHILGTLDDKIELNHRMNDTLEVMARALFKSWFVDFEPVRAKMEGRWRRSESLPGMPSELYDLFPSRLVASEASDVPEGWKIGKLGDLATFVRGHSYRSADLADSDTALVSLKSFKRGGGYQSDGLKPYTGRFRYEQVIKPGEVVLACTDVTQAAEVVGRPAMVQPEPSYSRLVASLDTMIVRPNADGISNEFLYLLCGTQDFSNYAYAHTTGTTVLHLVKDAVPLFQVAIPSLEVLLAFEEFSSLVCSKLRAISLDNFLLTALRDALLPWLVNGTFHREPFEGY